jgi:hypothetical protein
MTKRILISILLLQSCAFIDYSQVPNLIKVSIFGEDEIIIDQDFIDSRKFSFARVKVGKKYAIMSLSSINNGLYKWVSAENEFLYTTKKGKIVKSRGLPYDFSLIKDDKGERVIELTNPKGLFFQNINTSQKEIGSELVIQDSFKTLDYRWFGKNEYIIDKKNGLPIKSLQATHPYLGTIEIDFYFKF